MKREVIAEHAIWRAKKNYAMAVWYNENVKYDKPKIKILGLESVKGSTPEICREWLTEAFRISLIGTEDELQAHVRKCRKEYEDIAITKIANPKGVSSIDKYVERDKDGKYKGLRKGTPINSRGAIMFNKILEEKFLLGKYEPIKEFDKVRSLYLKEPNPTGGNTIAFKTVLPPELDMEQYIDYDKMFDKFFASPCASISNLVGYSLWPIYTLDLLAVAC